VTNIDECDISEYMTDISGTFKEKDDDSVQQYFIPVRNQNSSIECINPKYITNEDVLEKLIN